MTAPACSEEDFIALFTKLGATGTANELGVTVRRVHSRRRSIEARMGAQINMNRPFTCPEYPARTIYEIQNGVGIIGSDAHYWPDIISPAHRGMVHLIKMLKPNFVCLNGDLGDGARTGRHARIAWAKTPTTAQELQALEDRTKEIEDAAQDDCELFWTRGNHDMRFDTYLSGRAPDMEGVPGMSLAERFPHWRVTMSLWVNEDVVIKHRYKGGEHATHTNTMRAGKTMVTGHLHSLKVTPFDDYNGTRWGVDTGTLMDPYGPQADYDEDNPKNHRSGFIVLTFKDGVLLWPEIAYVMDSKHICFRSQIIEI